MKQKPKSPHKKVVSPWQISGIEVRTTKSKGRGVFALKDFALGDVVEISPIIDLGRQDGEIVQCTRLGDYTFSSASYEENTVVALGYASLYNHSRNNNCDFLVGETSIVIKAVEAVKAGDELTFDYGWEDEDYERNGIDPES